MVLIRVLILKIGPDTDPKKKKKSSLYQKNIQVYTNLCEIAQFCVTCILILEACRLGIGAQP